MPLKARIYDLVLAPWEHLGFAARRRDLFEGATGRILEIGVGTGLNLRHYPHSARVTAIDPQRPLLSRARDRTRSGQNLVCAGAEVLPFPDAVFDAVVGTLVFCTVGEPAIGLRESRRVLKPDGELRLIEHVRWKHHPWMARLQDWLTPAWKLVADGCHLNRPTEELVERAGFTIFSRREDADGLVIELRARARARPPAGHVL